MCVSCGTGGPSHATVDVVDRPEGLVAGRVDEVIDGDSLRVEIPTAGSIEVRLAGVNANEAGECHHDEASRFLDDLLDGRSVGLEETGVDQYGRALGFIWIGDELANLSTVIEGHAIAVSGSEDNPYEQLLVEAEETAYESSVGMWSATACGESGPTPEITIELTNVNPPGPDEDVLDDESVTIVNNSEEQVDMGGWTLRDESARNRLPFPPGTIVGAGGSLVIRSGCATSPSWCAGTPIWNNDGDMVLLLDELGTVVARARY